MTCWGASLGLRVNTEVELSTTVGIGIIISSNTCRRCQPLLLLGKDSLRIQLTGNPAEAQAIQSPFGRVPLGLRIVHIQLATGSAVAHQVFKRLTHEGSCETTSRIAGELSNFLGRLCDLWLIRRGCYVFQVLQLQPRLLMRFRWHS